MFEFLGQKKDVFYGVTKFSSAKYCMICTVSEFLRSPKEIGLCCGIEQFLFHFKINNVSVSYFGQNLLLLCFFMKGVKKHIFLS